MNNIIVKKESNFFSLAAIMRHIASILTVVIMLTSLFAITANASPNRHEIAFIYSNVKSMQVLEEAIRPGVEVVYIDGKRDGIIQIADMLAKRHDIDAVHIISHGAPGKVFLGNSILSAENLGKYDEQLGIIGKSLQKGGDILLYGCNIAKGAAGMDFIRKLSVHTDADVAASDDSTGSKKLGGNWILEAQTGTIESKTVFADSSVDAYTGLLTLTPPLLENLTTFPGLTNAAYFAGPITPGYTTPYIISAADVAGSGYDIVAESNINTGSLSIRAFNASGYGSGDTTSVRVYSNGFSYIDIRSNNHSFIFDFTSMDIRFGYTGTYTIQALDYNGSTFVTKGTPVPVNVGTAGTFISTGDLSTNPDFDGIYGVRIVLGTMNPAGCPYFDNIQVTNVRVPSSTISPNTGSFDKKTSAQADVVTTMTLNGNTLSSITNGANTLISGTDYTVSGNTVTIKKEYLAAQAVGTANLTFNFSAGNTQTLTITVADTTPVTYTLTYTAGANGSITGSTPQTVNSGASGTAVTAVPNTGYHFVSWSDGVNTAARTDSNVTSNKSVTATFAVDTYTLTYTAGANGSITGSTPQTVNSGGSGTAVTAVPNTGYHFVNWSDGVNTATRTDSNVTSNKSVTATFAVDTPTTVTITAGKGLGRVVTGKPAYANAKIPFYIDDQSFTKNITSYSFDVIYDPTKVGTVTVDSLNGLNVLTKPTVGAPTADGSKEKVTVSWNGTFTGDLTTLYNTNKGMLFRLNFVVKSTFTSGDAETPIEVGTGSFTFASGSSTTSITGNNGKVMFGVYGDVNGDGKINSLDGNVINSYINGNANAIKGEANQLAADVNGDGVKGAADDAVEISNYVQRKLSTLNTLFGY